MPAFIVILMVLINYAFAIIGTHQVVKDSKPVLAAMPGSI